MIHWSLCYFALAFLSKKGNDIYFFGRTTFFEREKESGKFPWKTNNLQVTSSSSSSSSHKVSFLPFRNSVIRFFEIVRIRSCFWASELWRTAERRQRTMLFLVFFLDFRCFFAFYFVLLFDWFCLFLLFFVDSLHLATEEWRSGVSSFEFLSICPLFLLCNGKGKTLNEWSWQSGKVWQGQVLYQTSFIIYDR